MRRHTTLAAVSAAQLVAGVAGHVIAVRERRSFDITLIGWRGRPERVGRDALYLGTGLSPPVTMLTAQAYQTARLVSGPDPDAQRLLGVLGAAMTCGYLVEREVHDALAPGGWHPVRTPVVAVGLVLSTTMAALGLRGRVRPSR